MYKRVFTFIVLCIAVFVSCKKEHDRPQWDVELLGPLVKGSLGIGNLITDTLIRENSDSTLTLGYDKTLYSLTLDSLVDIPDTTISTYFPLPGGLTLNAGFPFSFPSQETNLAIQNVQLRYAIIKNGKAHIEAVNKLHTKVYFTYTIPKATLNGVPFVANAVVDSADKNGPKTLVSDFDLSGYNLDLTGINGNKVNSIAYKVQAHTDPSGPSVTIPTSPPIDTVLTISNGFIDIVPYYVLGYLGQTTLDIGPDSTLLDLFKTIRSGTLDLESATMKLTIENDIGMDARLKVLNIKSVNTNKNYTVDLDAPSIINQTLNINRALASGTATNPSYIPSFYMLQIDNSNSNFKSLLENLPDYLSYALKLETNPFGNISGSNDFAFGDHLVSANINLEVPLYLSSNQLTFSDTSDFSLAGDTTLDNLGAGSFIFNVDNGFPFAVNLTLVTIDSLNHFLDKLISNGVAEAPPLDANLKVISKKRSQFVIPVDEDRIELLRHAKRMIVTAAFTTAAGSQRIKIYSDYTIDFKLIADINYHVR